MFKHILLPVDGSGLSLRAADIGIALAARLGARIHALHVLPPFPAATYLAAIAQANEAMYVERAMARAERVLAEVQQRAQAADVPCKGSHVTDSRPDCAIIAAVAKYQCDLIVMATHGARGIERMLLGSVTQKVLLAADVPVLICR